MIEENTSKHKGIELLSKQNICICDSTSSTTKVEIIKHQTSNEIMIWERDFRCRIQLCSICNLPVRLISYYLIRDRVRFVKLEKKALNFNRKIKIALNLFRDQNQVSYRRLRTILQENTLEIITNLWKKGIISIHRKKKHSRLIIPSELENSIPEWLDESPSVNWLELGKISLTEKGRDYLRIELSWELDKEIISQAKYILLDIEKISDLRNTNQRLLFLNNLLYSIKMRVLEGEYKSFYNEIIEKPVLSFDPHTGYFLAVIQILKQLYWTIVNSKIVFPFDMSTELDLSIEKIRYVRVKLKKILVVNPVFFNFPRSDLYSEKNPLSIPREIQTILDEFEIKLRSFLIKQLIKNKDTPIHAYFPSGKFRNLKKKAINEMKESKIDLNIIEQFRESQFSNNENLEWIFEQMSNKDYSTFITHNWSFLSNYFSNLDYEDDFSKEIGPFRNIKAHLKTKADRNLSKILGLLYQYELVIQRD